MSANAVKLPQSAQDLLAKPNHAIVAVNRASGGPQMTPVWYLWDGETFHFSTTRNRAKYNNLRRNGAITLLVDDCDDFGYVAAYGQAETVPHDDPTFRDVTTRLVAKYLPPEQLEPTLTDSLGADRVLIRLRPEKIVGPRGE